MYGFSNYGFAIAICLITIMIAVGGIASGLGIALNNRRLKEFGIEELYQSMINGALLGCLLIIFMPNGLITNIVNAVALSNTTSLSCSSQLSQNYAICFGYNYLSGPGYTLDGVSHPSILSQTTQLTVGFLGLSAIIGVIAGVNINAAIVSISLSSVLNPVINQIQYFVKILTTISISTLVQSSLLLVVASSAITIVLPIGLILRTFYPTRKLGGFLIAVAIGMYVIFPMSYVLNANIINSFSIASSNSTITQVTGSATSLENMALSGSNKLSIINAIANSANSISSAFSGITNTIVGVIAYFILAAFILPAFSLIITAVSIRELSAVFGSEISFNIFDAV